MSDEVEAIKASDLVLLMKVVEQATGLYNVLEKIEVALPIEFHKLGKALRELGLQEAT